MTDRPAPGTPPEQPPGLDLDRLADYLAVNRPDLVDGPLRARLIAGGRSNLTYVVSSGAREVVLRRPPLGHVLATAHDMTREFRVISALAPTRVPVPTPLMLCVDDAALGAPFYLMEQVDGVVFRHRAQTDALTPDQRRRLAFAMMDTLADLHMVDPVEVGLADFGRPEGFLARQVRRWAAQLDRSRSRPLPGIEELRDRLAAGVPRATGGGGRGGGGGSGGSADGGSGGGGRIVHGDYRLDNLMVDPATLAVRAVLDWEMATLGDPLTDLGLLLTYWEVLGGDAGDSGGDGGGSRDGAGRLAGNPVADGLGVRAGFPTGAELIERYAARSDLDVGPLHWHVGLGCFKLAVICEGIHYRYTLGQTIGAGFDRIGELVGPLVAHGLAAVKEEN